MMLQPTQITRRRRHAKHANTVGPAMIETVVTSKCSVICRPIGNLDWVGAVYLRDAVAGILHPKVELVIDFSMVTTIDSDGVVALRNSMELVRLIGGETRFCGMSPLIAEAIGFAGLGPSGRRINRTVRVAAH